MEILTKINSSAEGSRGDLGKTFDIGSIMGDVVTLFNSKVWIEKMQSESDFASIEKVFMRFIKTFKMSQTSYV